jgi:hypothetical protein
VYSAISKDTLTWLCAARLYTSLGLLFVSTGVLSRTSASELEWYCVTHCTCETMQPRFVLSVRSP